MMDTIYCKKETFLYGFKKQLQQSYQSLYTTNLIDRHLRHLFVCVCVCVLRGWWMRMWRKEEKMKY